MRPGVSRVRALTAFSSLPYAGSVLSIVDFSGRAVPIDWRQACRYPRRSGRTR